MKIGRLASAFLGGLLVWFAAQYLGGALLTLTVRAELPGDILLLTVFGVPLLLAIVAAVWTYSHPPADMFANDSADNAPWPEPRAAFAPRPTRRLRRRGPRSRRSLGP